MAKHVIKFFEQGFRDILTGPGVDGMVAAAARKKAATLEARTGTPYRVEKATGISSRSVYTARPDIPEGRVAGLTHEQWINELWPRIGGPKWRPH